MTISFKGNTLTIDGQLVQLAWPILDAIEEGNRLFVLLDPDSYLLDPSYKKMRRQGTPAIRNSSKPLVVNSFSSYRCEINSENGTILKKEFLK
jgi:hypothetical protein